VNWWLGMMRVRLRSEDEAGRGEKAEVDRAKDDEGGVLEWVRALYFSDPGW
jgi:hypothetical protein